jgi:hypothetical protein
MNHHGLNAYWKAVVDSIQDGVMIVDPDLDTAPPGARGGHPAAVGFLLTSSKRPI